MRLPVWRGSAADLAGLDTLMSRRRLRKDLISRPEAGLSNLRSARASARTPPASHTLNESQRHIQNGCQLTPVAPPDSRAPLSTPSLNSQRSGSSAPPHPHIKKISANLHKQPHITNFKPTPAPTCNWNGLLCGSGNSPLNRRVDPEVGYDR